MDIRAVVSAVEEASEARLNPTLQWIADLPEDDRVALEGAVRRGVAISSLLAGLKEAGAPIGGNAFYDWAKRVKRERR